MKNRIHLLGTVIITIFILSTCKSRENKSTTGRTDYAWLEEITISELQQGYRDKKFTVSEVVSAYLSRIEDIDNNGPALNAI